MNINTHACSSMPHLDIYIKVHTNSKPSYPSCHITIQACYPFTAITPIGSHGPIKQSDSPSWNCSTITRTQLRTPEDRPYIQSRLSLHTILELQHTVPILGTWNTPSLHSNSCYSFFAITSNMAPITNPSNRVPHGPFADNNHIASIHHYMIKKNDVIQPSLG